jgi:hypothetical protein
MPAPTIRMASGMSPDLTERLNQMADWKDEIRRRLADALNDVWGGRPDYDELRKEVERFTAACRDFRP